MDAAGPRDYLSSFLKIGTIALLVVGVFLANPKLPSPAYNPVFVNGGPTFPGHLFPFVFICIMCGAISGFHSLVSSGTTPKMIDKESQVRTIGYGAMLMEGLVGIMALIAAASLDPKLYYDINVPLDKAQQWQQPLDKMYTELGNVDSIEHLNLAQVEQKVGGESLRGRTGGAVTLAVGMSHILTKPLSQLGLPFDTLMKYWYHFAIMFEALFILTTIDAGTRIGRFLVQEALGAVHPKFAQTDWLAERAVGDVPRHGGLGRAGGDGIDGDDLADVRHRQSAAGGDRAGAGDDAAGQQRSRQVRAGDGAADAVRHRHDHDGRRADVQRQIHRFDASGTGADRSAEPDYDRVRDDVRGGAADPRRQPLGAGGEGTHAAAAK